MYNNISISGRIFRIALSTGLIVAVLNSTGPLGAMVYLPFVSIYAGLTAFIGWDPVNAIANGIGPRLAKAKVHPVVLEKATG